MKIDYDLCELIINGILLSIMVFNHLKVIPSPLFSLRIAILLVVVFNVGIMTKNWVG